MENTQNKYFYDPSNNQFHSNFGFKTGVLKKNEEVQRGNESVSFEALNEAEISKSIKKLNNFNNSESNPWQKIENFESNKNWREVNKDDTILPKFIYNDYDPIIKNINESTSTPYDFFKLYFSDNLLDYIVTCTNQYAKFKKEKYEKYEKSLTYKTSDSMDSENERASIDLDLNYEKNDDDKEKIYERKAPKTSLKWKNLNRHELETFLASYILIHIQQLPSLKMHYNKSDIIFSKLPEFISEWRYNMIQRFLHISQSDSKDLEKFKYVLDDINNKSKFYFYPGYYVTIDERMISWKGRSSLVKYEPRKPTKWGFRPYILADNKTGFTFEIIITDDLKENYEYSKIENLVFSMMENLKQPHILVTDSFYTTEKILESKKFGFIGSIKANRVTLSNKEKNKKMKKYDKMFYANDYGLLTKFYDKKIMYVISNVHSNNIENTTRWDNKKKTNIHIPKVIKDYSINMKGVDNSNQLISYYELNRRTIKWWKRIFFHLVDMSIVNSWILYKLKTNKKISQLEFRMKIIEHIKEKSKKIDLFHFPVKNELRKTCKYCILNNGKSMRGTSKNPTSLYSCSNCGVFLCIECFVLYHSETSIHK